MSIPTSSSGRIVAMDQFRGYTVAGMFLVNFLGDYLHVWPVLKHNNTWNSFADTIMPSFIFAVGFSYRLTILKRLPQWGAIKTYLSYIKRSLLLCVISLMLFAGGDIDGFRRWSELVDQEATAAAQSTAETNADGTSKPVEPVVTGKSVWDAWKPRIIGTLKADLWETLAIIGACQLFIMPVIAAPWYIRLVAMQVCMFGYIALCQWFNWGYVFGYEDNWMVQLWGTGGKSSWDGGFFGIMSWSVAMLAGTLAHDIVSTNSPGGTAKRVVAWGLLLMVLGYGMSCLTRLYDKGEYAKSLGVTPAEVDPNHGKGNFPLSPVIPPLSEISKRPFSTLLAEPPFVNPTPRPPKMEDLTPEEREAEAKKVRVERFDNFWMMGKKAVNTSYITFSAGFAFFLFGVFVVMCDILPIRIGVFRTLGMNALAAYCIHEITMHNTKPFIPRDAAWWYVTIGFAVFFMITYLFVRGLEKQDIYIKL